MHTLSGAVSAQGLERRVADAALDLYPSIIPEVEEFSTQHLTTAESSAPSDHSAPKLTCLKVVFDERLDSDR